MELELRIMELIGSMFSEPLRGNGGDFICILQDTADFLPYNLCFYSSKKRFCSSFFLLISIFFLLISSFI